MKLIDANVHHVFHPIVRVPVESERDLIRVKIIGWNQARRERVEDGLAGSLRLNTGETDGKFEGSHAAPFASWSVRAEERFLHARSSVFRPLFAGQQIRSADVPCFGADARR